MAEGAQGEALQTLLALGEGYAAALPEPWIFEGEIRAIDPELDLLVLEPRIEAQVSVCEDNRDWSVVGDPADYIPSGPEIFTYTVVPNSAGRWFVTDYAGGEERSPCVP